MNELATINRLQQAQMIIHEVTELDDIKRLIDQSEALKGYARAQDLSKEMQNDIVEYNLYATRQMGIISAGLEKASQDRGNQYQKVADTKSRYLPKKEVLAKAGIDIRRANEAEKLAAIPETKFAEKITKKRESGELTKTAVIADIKLEQRHEEIKKKFESKAEISTGRIIEGDLFDKISEIPDSTIDMLFADPPYMILNEQWDTYENIRQFMDFTERWLRVVIPKIKDTGRLYISFSQYYQFDLYNLLQKHDFFGFHFGQVIIWNYRNNNKPSNRKLYRFAYEPVFYLYGKNAGELNFPPESYGETSSNVWTIATPQSNFHEGKYHPAQKPLELLERIIMTGSKENDIILDPFAGSGTTGIAAQKLKRDFILIEKDPEYCKIAKGRLNDVG